MPNRRLLRYNIAMFKLIVSDLDGTLLPPSKIMPDETFPLIEKFTSKGGVFAPASGRQLPNLKKLFAPVADKIAIIAENGGIVWYGGKIIYSNPTAPADLIRALEIIRGVEGIYPVLSCDDCAYYEDDFPLFVETVKKSYSSEMLVPDLDEMAKCKTALKISVWDSRPAAEHAGKILPQLIDGLRVMISGFDWLDVSVATANKGNALRALMQYLGCTREQCAAFGDHMNDYEMLCECGSPFVTANAYPLLKEKIGVEIASNRENGVIEKLKELI